MLLWYWRLRGWRRFLHGARRQHTLWLKGCTIDNESAQAFARLMDDEWADWDPCYVHLEY